MVVIKKQEVDKIKEKCEKLFSIRTIYLNDIDKNIDHYKKFYSNVNVMSFLNDVDLVNTALSFFENNLNISLTSKKTFMHRNTLVYRIEKIKKYIGLDIRNFKDAVLLENLIIFYKSEVENI